MKILVFHYSLEIRLHCKACRPVTGWQVTKCWLHVLRLLLDMLQGQQGKVEPFVVLTLSGNPLIPLFRLVTKGVKANFPNEQVIQHSSNTCTSFIQQ